MRKRILLLANLVFICLISFQLDAADTRKLLYITFLDVGQGDCSFIRTPGGHTMLIDGGGRSDSKDGTLVGEKVVLPYLRHEGVSKLDIVLLTHPHDDHLQGLLPVIKTMRIGRILDSGFSNPAESYIQYLRIIKSRKIPHMRVYRGQKIDFKDGASISILSPPGSALKTPSEDQNNDSLVFKLNCYKRAFLFTGDAGFDAEDNMMNSKLNLRSGIIKIGHHGSRFSTGKRFLDAVNPKAAVISVGKSNPFGHPSKETLDKLKNHNVIVYRTDRNGAVMLKCDNKGTITLRPTKQNRMLPTAQKRSVDRLPF
ncbi:MAG: ComEC/Rec2 family competence protein [Armatimonadota bacterium]